MGNSRLIPESRKHKPAKLLIFVLSVFLGFAGNSWAGEEALLPVSSFSTSIEDQENNVKQNLYLACQKLDGYVIMPKAVFSFNDVVGEGSAKNGFLTGRVMYRDAIRYEAGGGLCQASSTLFNAMLLAGFTIIERHRHHQPVTYVPLGLDATIMYGKKNLRLKNPFNEKFYIEASVTDKSMLIVIKGDNPLSDRYEMVTDEEELENAVDNSRDVRNGLSINVFRVRHRPNGAMEKSLLYRDYYPPVYLK